MSRNRGRKIGKGKRLFRSSSDQLKDKHRYDDGLEIGRLNLLDQTADDKGNGLILSLYIPAGAGKSFWATEISKHFQMSR